VFVTAKVESMDGKAQTGFHNESRVGEVRVHARQLAKANQLMWWIGLLFGKVESVSGTNSMEQNTKTRNTNLTSNKTQPRWTQTQQSN
jgi:hypothetical protein